MAHHDTKKGWAHRVELDHEEQEKKELQAKLEFQKREKARREHERLQAEAFARAEAERLARLEADRLEKERIAREEFEAKLKADRELEDARIFEMSRHQHVLDYDPRDESEYEKKYPEYIRRKAAKLTFFKPDSPRNIPEGVSFGEYNITKGLLSGTALFFTAPWWSASMAMHKADEAAIADGKDGAGFFNKTGAAFYGFGAGVVHGTVCGVSLMTVGCTLGGEQLGRGVFCAPPIPGQGRTLYDNWRHVIYSRTLDIATLREPENFKKELEEMKREGLIPEKKYDIYGKEIDYTYQFFMTDEPKDVVDGFGGLQYNSVKGFVAGVTLAACAPMCDAIEQANEVDEDGNAGGFEGGVKGFGEGICRGIVGGFTLWGSGMYYGGIQLGKGAVSLDNIAVIVKSSDSFSTDLARINEEPIEKAVFQTRWGLEDVLMRESVKKWEEEHKGEEFPGYGWEDGEIDLGESTVVDEAEGYPEYEQPEHHRAPPKEVAEPVRRE